MKKTILVLALMGFANGAFAGGLSEPAMDPAVVAEEVASSGSDNWVGIMMLVLVAAAAASN